MKIFNKGTEDEYIEASLIETIKFFIKGWIKFSNISLFPNYTYVLEGDIHADYDSIRKECLKDEKV